MGVRKSAENFKNLVMRNKVMIFSATYCSYCTVAKNTLGDLGTQFQSYEVNKSGSEGNMMMDVVEAVTGNRTVPQIFICGQLVPGGGSGLKHLASTGQLTEIPAVVSLINTLSTSPCYPIISEYNPRIWCPA